MVVWEWSFSIPREGDVQDARLNMALSNDDFWVFDSTWSDFKPFYRGRPVDPDTAGEFRPEDTYEWSLMARSNFQAQSGPFALQLHSLNALPSEDQFVSTDSTADSTVVVDHQEPSPQTWVDEKSTHSFRARFPTASVAEPSTTTRSAAGEYYGFALFIFATLLWVGWIAWALTPDRVLQSVGIGWYPNREWAFLIPAWSLLAVLATYAVFIGLNARSTPELGEIVTVTGKSRRGPQGVDQSMLAANKVGADSLLLLCETDSAQNVLPVSMDDEKHLLEDQEALANSLHDIYDLPPTYASRQMHLG